MAAPVRQQLAEDDEMLKSRGSDQRLSDTLKGIQDRFAPGYGLKIAIPGRTLLKEEKVWKQGKLSKTERTLMLFDDLLFVCKPTKDGKLVPKETYPLDEIFIDENVSKGLIKMKNSIKVRRKGENDYVVLGFPDEDTREMWLTLIKATARSYMKKSMSNMMAYGAGTELHHGDLYWCVHHGKLREAKSMLESKANVNERNFDGVAPLHLAVHPSSNPTVDMVDLLLEHKANPSQRDTEGNTPFHLAIDQSLHAIFEILCHAAKPNVDIPDRNGVLPLELAVRKKVTSSVESLVEAKADPSKKIGEGKFSVAWLAATDKDPNPEYLHLFLNISEEIKTKVFEERDADGQSIVHAVSAAGNQDILSVILHEHRALVDAENSKTGATPLHSAARQDRKDAIELLMAMRARPNARDNTGNTPLHMATGSVRPMLVKYGAQPSLTNKHGKAGGSAEFKEIGSAIDFRQQMSAKIPETRVLEKGEKAWMPDEALDGCPLCGRQWAMMLRRHHCRRCGTLACANCSKKQCHLAHEEDSSRAYRVCDMCFNELSLKKLPRLVVKSKTENVWEEDEKDTKEEKHAPGDNSGPKEAAPTKKPVKAAKTKQKPVKFTRLEKRMLKEKNPQTAEEKAAFRSAVKKKYHYKSKEKTGATKKLMAENKRLAAERGKMLEKTGEEAEQMASEAKSFASVAKKLRQKQEKRWI